MNVIDVNLLLYAVNEGSPHHRKSKAWLETTLASGEFIVFPWMVLLGFIRLSTNSSVFESPLEPEQALEVVDGWLRQPSVRVLYSGRSHWPILRGLLMETGTAGNLTMDAHLAALAIESGYTLYSTDSDFARFRQLKWVNPIQA